jgi:uncharacterized protein
MAARPGPRDPAPIERVFFMSEYHEKWDALPEPARLFHRALKSLQEELEAVDWYHQRLSVSGEASLVELLAHNRDEEMEHASMLLEWLRRNMPGWDGQLRKYLFTEAPLLEVERAGTAVAPRDLGLGSLREKR